MSDKRRARRPRGIALADQLRSLRILQRRQLVMQEKTLKGSIYDALLAGTVARSVVVP